MNKTQEIQYLGLMLTATNEIDKKRIRTIIYRLKVLLQEEKTNTGC